jgi:UDP-N-acetylglucosamine acyltransferase
MASIHPTASVDPKAEIADDVEIGPHCTVTEGVRLGPGNVLTSGVVITGRTEAGPGNRFFPHAVIGTEPQDLKFRGEDTRLSIGEGNTFREHVTVNRGTDKGGGVTTIGSHNLFMACCHVAHDCFVGDNVVMANNVLLGGHIRIEDDAVLSGAAACHHFTTVGRSAFVGGLTRIVRDVPPYMIVEGNPARIRGVNVVKLERMGMEEDRIRALKDAYRLLWKTGNSFEESLGELESRDSLSEEVQILTTFLRRTGQGEHGRALESTRRT